MARTSRTFKLGLSPAGMDLLIDAHCHLIRCTRQLLPWGTTLHVAVDHLATLPADRVSAELAEVQAAGLNGREVHFLGAPTRLHDVARRVVEQVGSLRLGTTAPTLLSVYLVSLRLLLAAEAGPLQAAYERIVG